LDYYYLMTPLTTTTIFHRFHRITTDDRRARGRETHKTCKNIFIDINHLSPCRSPRGAIAFRHRVRHRVARVAFASPFVLRAPVRIPLAFARVRQNSTPHDARDAYARRTTRRRRARRSTSTTPFVVARFGVRPGVRERASAMRMGDDHRW